MSEQSAKPYLIRAICEWCADNGLTPYLAVKVNAQTRVPVAHVKNGEIVLNISRGATRRTRRYTSRMPGEDPIMPGSGASSRSGRTRRSGSATARSLRATRWPSRKPPSR